MKRTIRMTAYDGNGTRLKVTVQADIRNLHPSWTTTVAMQANGFAADVKDALMEMLPKLPHSQFNLSDAKFHK